MSESKREKFRKRAKKIADKHGFHVDDMLFCQECGKYVLRKQIRKDPGVEDKIFCTCEPNGPPMLPVQK